MKNLKCGLLPVLACAASLAFGAAPGFDPKVYLDEIRYLASPELRGRLTGSPQLEQAAHWLVERYREAGVPAAAKNGYLLPFQVTTSGTLGAGNRLQFREGSAQPMTIEFRRDFVPFQFSSSQHVAGRVVFAGYGITAPELHYDDYAGIDVKGRIVLILRHEPQEMDEHSVFAGKELTTHAQFSSKASNAKMHGAVGVILVNDTAAHPGEPDELARFGAADGPEDAGIAFVQVKEAAVEGWFRDAGKSLASIEAGIDKDLQPESFAFPASLQVDETVDILRERKTVHNVVAYLAGETGEYVIVGAHYDHLGLGEHYSLAPGQAGTVHPGADDNASGTAGAIDLARWFASQPKQKRGILFLNFAGEEEGVA